MIETNFPLLYFVTPEIGEKLHAWIDLIKEAVIGGAKVIQIRDKQSSARKICMAAKILQPFLKERGAFLIINDRVDIAHAVEADGVHIGQTDLTVEETRAILGHNAIIGLSVETITQAKKACNANIQYIAASPVFKTTTKHDCSKPWELDGLKQLCAFSRHPVIAIGGIKLNNVEDVIISGANGIAVVSAISKAPSPKHAAKELIEKMRSPLQCKL